MREYHHNSDFPHLKIESTEYDRNRINPITKHQNTPKKQFMPALETPKQKQKGCSQVSENDEMVKSYQNIPKSDGDSSPFALSEAKQGAVSDTKKVSEYNLKKMTIIISLVIVLVAAASFLAFYFTMDHSNIQIQLVRDGSGEINGQAISYQQHSVTLTYKDNTQEEMSIISVRQKDIPTGRLLADGATQEISDLTCYYGSTKSSADTVRICNSAIPSNPNYFSYDSMSDGNELLKQIQASTETDPSSRLLEGAGTPQDAAAIAAEKISSFIEDLKNEEGMHLSFSVSQDPVDLANHQSNFYGNSQPVVTQKVENLINPSSETDAGTSKDTSGSPARMLRRWRWKKMIAKVVKVIQKSAPIICAAVGAVIGGVVGTMAGGPAAGFVAAVEGAKLGYQVGSIASAVAKDCLPETASGNIKFKCDLKKLTIDAAVIASVQVASSSKIVAKASALVASK